MKGLTLIILIFFVYITYAVPIEEFSFSEQGYPDFYINEADSFDCTRYDFVYENDLNSGLFPIISLKVDFSPQSTGEATITVYFNSNDPIAELKSTDFSNKTARISIPINEIRENNNLKVCGKTSFSINSIKISSDSTFGVYSAPFFPEENGFELELETYRPIVGIPFNVDAIVRNYGSEDVSVNLTYRKEALEENTPEVTVLSGETTNSGLVPKCVERNEEGECTVPGVYKISYVMVANRAVPMTLLPAQMSYTNIFGEEVKLQTNRPSIEAFNAAHQLTSQIFLDKDNPFTGETIPVRVSIRNIGTTKVVQTVITLKTGLEIIGKGFRVIDSLEAGQTSEAIFNVKGITEGNYSLGCNITYNNKTLECTKTSVSLETSGIGNEVLIGIAFILLALAVFAYYHFK